MTAGVHNLAAVIPLPIGCVEAERGVLGGLLCLPALEAQVAAGALTPRDFTDPRHTAIFESVVELTSAGTPADPITVSGYLRRAGQERCFTSDRAPAVFLFDLLDALPCLGNLEHYRKIVLEHSARRRARDASARVAQAAEQEDLDTARQVTVAEMLAVLEAFDRIGPTS
jgi:replicative DNA helicase